MKRLKSANKSCGTQLHEWQYQAYYCAFMDGSSTMPFACASCGDFPTCGGQMVRQVCSRCGAKEWIYLESMKDRSP